MLIELLDSATGKCPGEWARKPWDGQEEIKFLFPGGWPVTLVTFVVDGTVFRFANEVRLVTRGDILTLTLEGWPRPVVSYTELDAFARFADRPPPPPRFRDRLLRR